MFDLFRKGEVLPTGRTDNEEKQLVQAGHTTPSGGTPENQNGQPNQAGVKGSPSGLPPGNGQPPAAP
jgi:hypothetical protein